MATGSDKIDRTTLVTALVLVVGGLAVIFDTTIVSIALHTLAVQLNSSVSVIQWVSTGYLLALGATIPLVGWAQARIGGKRLWMIALMIFAIGSIAASLAWSAPSLIAFRVLQGIGGGLMMPLMATLAVQAAGGRDLGKLMAVVSLPAALGPILGPVLGGIILSQLDWRWLFWVNVPFCVVGILLAWRCLKIDDVPAKGSGAAKPKLDVLGLLLIAPGTSVLLLGLANAGTGSGFGRADVIVPLVVGAALLAGFVVYALRGSRPLVEVRLLAKRSVASSSAVLFFSGFALYGAMLLMPLYYQDVRGASALSAGVLLVPQGVGTILSRLVTGGAIDRIGARVIASAGFAIVTVSTIPFALAGAHTSEWQLAVWLVVRGFGLGAVTMPVMVAGYIGLEKHQIPHSSVLTRTAQQIGGSFGTAVLAVILQDGISAHPKAPVDAFHTAFWWSVGFSAVAVLLSVTLPGVQRAAEAETDAGTPAVSAASR